MISKKVMNKAIELEKEFKLKDIMYYQMYVSNKIQMGYNTLNSKIL